VVVPLLDASTTLPSGPRVRVRVPHRADADGLRALLDRLGLAAAELELSRALRPDPRERLSVVAVVLVDRTEEVVGFAAMERDADDAELVLADEERAPGVGALLAGALAEHGRRARRIA
jgi:hypothetical protein